MDQHRASGMKRPRVLVHCRRSAMLHRILIFIVVAALGLVGACSNTAPLEEEPVVTPTTVEEIDEGEGPDPEDVVSATGTVRYVDLEGGFYGIVSRDDQRYLPQNLPDSLRHDGRHVRFRGTLQRDVVTIQQWGTPIELIDIAPVGELLDDE